MVKRGSITVFLALTLGLILSLLSSGLESARMAAARTQILNGMDIGLYSLFGQYNKSLLKDFDLFAVDGACGGKEMNLAMIVTVLFCKFTQSASITSGSIPSRQIVSIPASIANAVILRFSTPLRMCISFKSSHPINAQLSILFAFT